MTYTKEDLFVGFRFKSGQNTTKYKLVKFTTNSKVVLLQSSSTNNLFDHSIDDILNELNKGNYKEVKLEIINYEIY